MNSVPFAGIFPAVLFLLPTLIWYVGVFVLLVKIWQELKAIRISR